MEQINTTHPGDQVTDVTPKAPLQFSSFDLNSRHLTTQTFGRIHINDHVHLVPADNVSYTNGLSIDTFTLSQRFYGNITAHKDSVFVPLRAVIPHNHDIAIEIPTVGDDTPITDDKNPLPSIKVGYLFSEPYFFESQAASAGSGNAINDWKWLMRAYCMIQYIFSPDSLIAATRRKIGFAPFIEYLRTNESDFAACETISDCLEVIESKLPGGVTFTTSETFNSQTDYKVFELDPTASSLKYDFSSARALIPWRLIPEISHLYGGLFTVTATSTSTSEYDDAKNIIHKFAYRAYTFFNTTSSGRAEEYLNFGPIVAYQLACAHFYTNDSVDDIFSANNFREYIKSLLFTIVPTTSYYYFTWNGQKRELDALSGGMMHCALQYASLSTASIGDAVFRYMTAIFGKNNSLRYRDYFISARPRMIAVGDTSVAVNSNKVSVIDVTKQIQAQRLFNWVNMTGRKIKNYISGLFGISAVTPDDDPLFLSGVSQRIHSTETENTGAAQVSDPDSITALLRSSGENFLFEFQARDYGYLLQLCYYDMPRFYNDAVEKQALMKTKYDMFNTFMQYQGDQEIKDVEFGGYSTGNYGYTTRDMQYKTRVDIATGAFDSLLDRYAPVLHYQSLSPLPLRICPTAIRSMSYELDKFYMSFTYKAPVNRFHFIVDNTSTVKIRRPMAVSPQILS